MEFCVISQGFPSQCNAMQISVYICVQKLIYCVIFVLEYCATSQEYVNWVQCSELQLLMYMQSSGGSDQNWEFEFAIGPKLGISSRALFNVSRLPHPNFLCQQLHLQQVSCDFLLFNSCPHFLPSLILYFCTPRSSILGLAGMIIWWKILMVALLLLSCFLVSTVLLHLWWHCVWKCVWKLK